MSVKSYSVGLLHALVLATLVVGAPATANTTETTMNSDLQVLSPLGVAASDLFVGEVYFVVAYIDQEKTIPTIDSLVFIGRNLLGETDGSLYFQDVESHAEHGPMKAIDSDATIVVTEAQPPPNLFRLEGVLDELSRCKMRRQLR